MQFQQDPFIIIKSNLSSSQNQEETNMKLRKAGNNSWSVQQHLQYINFFKDNMNRFEDEKNRKKCKIFIQMAHIIPTRTSVQIKSHHQKLMKKFHSVPKILRQLQSYLKRYYNEKVNDQDRRTEKRQLRNQGTSFDSSTAFASFEQYEAPRSILFSQTCNQSIQMDLFDVLANQNQDSFEITGKNYL